MSLGFMGGSGPLSRAHPFTPLTLAAVTAVLAFALPAPRGPLLVAAGLVAVVLIEGLPRVLRSALLAALPFWIFLLLIHGVLGRSSMAAVTIGARIFGIVTAFLLALATVHPGRLVDALVARGVPFSFAYLLAAALQAVPRLRARAKEILDAQRCRGLRVRGSPWRRARALVPLALPLVLSALNEVEERTLALEARGAGNVARRTPLEPPTDSRGERILRWAMAIAAVGAVGLRVWA
ncbi:MAG: energy-coupling factor transporter transmembrane protein EcfT [Gemmatimonadetes bacterium]|nr:energy-coupling factor transporter transmembrane protein EcfT [Gemmatimonadota bacterium]